MQKITETIFVPEDSEGLRLDKFLAAKLNSFSRTKINNLIKNNSVRVDTKIKKSSFRISKGQTISIEIPQKKERLKPYDFPVTIIFEDDDIVVVDKPSGLTVHPPQYDYYKTLVNALIFLKKDLSSLDTLRPGVVHRLDKETSGVMVLAKNNRSQDNLIDQFRRRRVKKEYSAIVWGDIQKKQFLINLPLQRDDKNRLKMKVGFHNSKEASTKVILSCRLEGAAFLVLYPLTGRMHQIRVHLNFLGYPIVGDKKYGIKDGYKDLFLHAKTLTFKHPTRKKILKFTSPLPQKFNDFITNNKLRDV